MNYRSNIAALAAGAVLLSSLLVGCAEAPSISNVNYSAPETRVLSSGTVLYVANFGRTNHALGDVTVYSASGKLLRTITTGIGQYPESLCTDSAGNLYVANSTDNNVAVYAPGKLTPERVITDGVKGPMGLLMDGSGNLYVAGSQSVTIYAAGASTPSAVIRERIARPRGMIFDKNGSLYVANSKGATTSYVSVYAASNHMYTRSISSGTAFVKSWKVGMAFDDTGKLYVADALTNTVQSMPTERS